MASAVLIVTFIHCILCCVNGFPEFVYERTTIAKCRISCIEKFSTSQTKQNNNYGCTTKLNWKCDMCWDFCEMLSLAEKTKTSEAMCEDDICLDGCKHACKYYEKNGRRIEKLKKADIDLVGVPKNKIGWFFNAEVTGSRPVFVVLGLKDGQWIEIEQTADAKLFLETTKFSKLMILAVNSKTTTQYVSQAYSRKIRARRHLRANDEGKELIASADTGFIKFVLQEQRLCALFLTFIFALAIIIAFVFCSCCRFAKQRNNSEPV